MDNKFQRIERLPPYVFNVIADLRQQARRKGKDIIDLAMGNPDQPTPPHIVKKMIETVKRGDTHRYSQSRGIPRLRLAMANWYSDRYRVELNAESEIIVTIGSKEENLNLLSKKDLINIMQKICISDYEIKYINFLFFKSNLVLIGQKN